MKYVRIRPISEQSWYVVGPVDGPATWPDLIGELAALCDNDEADTMEVQLVDMEEGDYDALFEFDGW